jgi:hypothetical protein
MRPIMRVSIVALSCILTAFPGKHGRVSAQEKRPARASSDRSARLSGHPQSKHDLFGRFVGKWDVSYQTFDKDGKVRRNRGQVAYVWILDGQAVQETWTSDAHLKEPKPFGTSIIFYDSKRQGWTEVWIYPAQGMTTIMNGDAVDGRIVLTGRDQDGAMLRWSFNDLQTNSFVWRGEISNDEGKTWRLQGENHIHRHRG